MRIFLATFVVVAAVAVGSSSVLAHRFTSVFIAPISGVNAKIGKQAFDGFMFATRERDGHADETADGHLGGLDVYVEVVDSADDIEVVLARLRYLIELEETEFVTGVVPSQLVETIRRQTDGMPTILIVANASPPTHIKTMDNRPFATAFEETFGYFPTQYSFAGYSVARIVDQEVRQVDGDFSKQDILNIAVSKRFRL